MLNLGFQRWGAIMRQSRARGLRGGTILAGLAALGVTGTAWAQQRPTISEPPALALTAPGGEKALLTETADPAKPPREVEARLDIVPIRSQIWNPNSRMVDQVELRGYQDALHPAVPGRPYVAPTLEATPGSTVRVFIRNLLAPEKDCPGHRADINVPHCFNSTNLHSHGLWVSPAGISDNVLRTLPPNKDFTYEYEYNIPLDHPAGTFWYHPHLHGSTAIQVASGMAGALIVTGTRIPRRDLTTGGILPGDVDVLMRAGGAAIPDNVFVLQQIQYICRDPDAPPGPSGLKPSKKNPDGTWRCDKGDVGVLDGYDVFGGSWKPSGRFTTVNGETMGLLNQRARVGIPERWRFIHAGVGDTIKVSIRKRREGAKALDFSKIGALSQDRIIEEQCAPASEAVPQFEIAADGLTRTRAVERTGTVLQPGYRSDVLVAFEGAGSYCVIDETVNVTQSGVQGSSDRRQLLFLVDVDPFTGPVRPARTQLAAMLSTAADALPIADRALKARIVEGLKTDLDLWAFTPHESLEKATIDTRQTLFFSLRNPATLPTPGPAIGHSADKLRRFDPEDFKRTLVLGNTDEWELAVDPKDTILIGHPFHIHVNPFEVMSVMKDGVDQTGVAASQYFGMKGVFKDTVFVEPGVVVKMRTHYRRYVGDFVLHCHILNHEDAGMMEMVRIADRGPDGKPMALGHGLTDEAAAHGH